jgi:hypothetical protein
MKRLFPASRGFTPAPAGSFAPDEWVTEYSGAELEGERIGAMTKAASVLGTLECALIADQSNTRP